jgi:hypothetical protein
MSGDGLLRKEKYRSEKTPEFIIGSILVHEE